MWQNIIVRYTLATLLVVVLVSGLLGHVLTLELTDGLIQTHVNVYPQTIRTLVKGHPETFEFLAAAPGTPLAPSVKSYFEDLLSLGSVFRIKVWNLDGTVIWSDSADLIGKSFPDNGHYQRARNGMVDFEISRPHKSEHVNESDRGRILEIYTPLFHQGKVAGVFELYESNEALAEQIVGNEKTVWLIVSCAGLAIYLLLFCVFYAAHVSQRRTAARLISTQDVVISVLAYQSGLHDIETGQHLDRTSLYLDLLANELSHHPLFRDQLSREKISQMVKAAPLHDIGKVGVPDRILKKPGPLTPDEFVRMQKHAEYGAKILEQAREKIPFASFIDVALEITLSHHEKWNGEGYPEGLAGEEIPLAARLMALVDVYDALRSWRCYKSPLPHRQCIEIITAKRGEHFQPEIVATFLRLEQDFLEISKAHADAKEDVKCLVQTSAQAAFES